MIALPEYMIEDQTIGTGHLFWNVVGAAHELIAIMRHWQINRFHDFWAFETFVKYGYYATERRLLEDMTAGTVDGHWHSIRTTKEFIAVSVVWYERVVLFAGANIWAIHLRHCG